MGPPEARPETQKAFDDDVQTLSDAIHRLASVDTTHPGPITVLAVAMLGKGGGTAEEIEAVAEWIDESMTPITIMSLGLHEQIQCRVHEGAVEFAARGVSPDG